MVTNEFNEFHGNLCQCNWYEFPLELQQMLITVMIYTQQPPAIKGLASTYCLREAFKRVSVTPSSI